MHSIFHRQALQNKLHEEMKEKSSKNQTCFSNIFIRTENTSENDATHFLKHIIYIYTNVAYMLLKGYIIYTHSFNGSHSTNDWLSMLCIFCNGYWEDHFAEGNTNTTNNIQLKTYPFYMKLTTAHVFYLYHIALWETFLDIKFHWTIRYCITNTWSWTTAAKSIFYSCIRNCLFLLIVFWIYCSITVLRQVK